MSVVGAWRIASGTEPAARELGDHSYYFSPHGELVVSSLLDGELARMLLTWKARGEQLLIDQPSAPRESPMRCLRASETTMQLDDSWYVREVGDGFDRDAAWCALFAGGSWYGIENADPQTPFTPFLMLETGAQRSLQRVVASSHHEAEAMAPRLLERQSYERAVWVRDGRITLDGVKTDAIVSAGYEPGTRHVMQGALPYRFEGRRARISGGLVFERL